MPESAAEVARQHGLDGKAFRRALRVVREKKEKGLRYHHDPVILCNRI